MPLTRDFRETIQARVERDPAFREELLKEGVECLLSGEVEVGKTVLRDFINATIGFETLGSLTGKSPKCLMRMFGPAAPPSSVGADPKPAICSRSSPVCRSARGFASKSGRFGRGFNPHSVLPSLVLETLRGFDRL